MWCNQFQALNTHSDINSEIWTIAEVPCFWKKLFNIVTVLDTKKGFGDLDVGQNFQREGQDNGVLFRKGEYWCGCKAYNYQFSL